MPAHIIGIRGLHEGKLAMLGDATITFGRTPENTFSIDDQLTSRRHAEIRFEPSGYVLYDLGSSNGTMVNGQRVQRHALTSGDQFEIGTAAFRYERTADVVAPLGKTALAPTFGDEEEMTSRSTPFSFELVAVRGPLAGLRFPLGLDIVTLGRTPDNIVQLQSPRSSRKHCEIRPQSSQLVMVDLNSSNGTFVNGQRVPTQVLQPGDEVSIGEESYQVVRVGEEPIVRPAAVVAPPVAAPAPMAAPPPQVQAYGVAPPAPAPVLFGAPPGPPAAPPPPAAFNPPPAMAPPPPPAPLPIPSFLGVSGSPAPFGGPPPVFVASAAPPVSFDDKTEPPPAMPGYMPDFNAPQQAPTGFAPVRAAPSQQQVFGAPPGPPAPQQGFGAPPGPPGGFGGPPAPSGFGPPPGPPSPSGFGPPPVAPPQQGYGQGPSSPSGNYGRPPVAAPEPPKMVTCPMCQRAVDARYTHCPYDATPLPSANPAW